MANIRVSTDGVALAIVTKPVTTVDGQLQIGHRLFTGSTVEIVADVPSDFSRGRYLFSAGTLIANPAFVEPVQPPDLREKIDALTLDADLKDVLLEIAGLE